MGFWQVCPFFRSIFCHEKKVLALVLAFACAFTMFAGAAFTDQADINTDNVEAVDLLTTLGIIKGYEDGSFDPEGTVDRAEMAKMIYTIRNGGNDDASAHVGNTTSFTDISGHWAEGYIKYLQNTGIVAGKSATKFDPDSTVTTGEAMKMALVLAGYRADKAGLTGTNWINNTLSYATTYGLTKDVKSSISGDCARQDAAQILSNALYMNAVVWSEFANDFVLDGVGGLGTGVRQTVGFKWMDLVEATGTYVANDKTNHALKDGYIQVNVTSTTDPDWTIRAANALRTANFAMNLDWIGEEVKVLYKDANNGVTGLDEKDSVYGIYNTGATVVYNTTKGALQDTSTARTIKFGDTEYDTVNGANINTLVNYVDTGANQQWNVFDKTNANNVYAVNSNDAIKFIVDDASGDIDTAYITTSSYGKIATITSDKIAVEGLGTVKLEDCDLYEGAAAGDIVKVTELYANNERVNLIEKADTISGTVTAYKDSDNQVQIDGTWYKYGANDAVASDYTSAALAQTSVSSTYSLIVDGGYYFAYDKIEGYNDYAIVTLGNSEFGDQRVKLLKADGTETIAVVDEKEGATTLPATGTANGELMAYTLKSDNTKVDLNETAVQTTAGAQNFVDKNNTLTGIGVVANDAAVFLYSEHADDLKWKVYTADQISDFTTTAAGVTYIVEDSKIVALAAHVATFPTAGADSVTYGYVTDRVDRTEIDGDKVVQLTIWDGENNITLNVDGACDAYAGDFIEFPVVADGTSAVSNGDITIDTAFRGTTRYANIKIKAVENGRIVATTDYVGADGQVVSRGTDVAYVITSDTKYIGVNTEDMESGSSNVPIIYTKAYREDFNNAAVIYDRTDNTIKAIFIDEENKLIPATNGTAGRATGTAAVADPLADVVVRDVSGTDNGIDFAVDYAKDEAVVGEEVTATITLSGTATAYTRLNITGGDNVKITNVTGTNVVKVDDDSVNVEQDTGTVAGTITITFNYTGADISVDGEDLYTVAAPGAITGGQGLSATAVADKEFVADGEKVTYTVTVTGTAAAAAKVTFTKGDYSLLVGAEASASGEGWTMQAVSDDAQEAFANFNAGGATLKFVVESARNGDITAPAIAIASNP